MLSSIVSVSVYIPTNSARGFPFLHPLSSITHHDLPHVLLGCLPTVNRGLCPGIALPSLYSSSQAPRVPGGLASLSRMHRAAARIVYVVLVPFRLSQVS